MRIRSGGRHRLRHAFAVGPNGERVEASSIRGRTIRFRKLKPGFTTVLQYRIDESADSYLSGHVASMVVWDLEFILSRHDGFFGLKKMSRSRSR